MDWASEDPSQQDKVENEELVGVKHGGVLSPYLPDWSVDNHERLLATDRKLVEQPMIDDGFCSWCGQALDHVLVSGFESRGSVPIRSPRNYSSEKSYPLFLHLHGYCQFAPFFLAENGLASEMAQKYGFEALHVVPQGLPSIHKGDYAWNSAPGSCCQKNQTIDDIGFLLKLVEDTLGKYPNIDQSKVFLVGWSNGGFISHRLACLAPPGFFCGSCNICWSNCHNIGKWPCEVRPKASNPTACCMGQLGPQHSMERTR